MSTSNRGFASMDKDRQREIASAGGKAAHARGSAHQYTCEEAAEAGRKGGIAVSQNREHMRAIGRKGGAASRGKQRGPRKAKIDLGVTLTHADGSETYISPEARST